MRDSSTIKEWRKRTKQRIVDSFGGKCCICGYNKCPEAFDVHHLDPEEKDFQLSIVRANPKNWNSIVEELRKCVLLCAVCHRELHAGIVKMPKDVTKFNEEFLDYRKIELLDKTSSLTNNCPVCGNDKPIWNYTCSRDCSIRMVGRYDWNKYDLNKLYIQDGLNLSQISKIVGCSSMSVRKRLIKEGIEVKNLKKKIHWPDKSVLAEKVKIQSLEFIRKEIGCSHAGLRKHLKNNGIQYKFKDSWRKRLLHKI